MNTLIVACSLNPGSRSALLASAARAALEERGARAELIDLRDTPLAVCDGTGADSAADEIARKIADADAVLLAVPIYNYDVNAAAKNLIELTGRRAWTEQTVGFLCAAGGHNSYMSVMPLANSLMLDFRCVVVPRFVYATAQDFDGDALSPGIAERVERLAGETLRLAGVMRRGARCVKAEG